jgi:hypothetical protein
VELDGDEHHANGDPYDGQSGLSSMQKSTAPYLGRGGRQGRISTPIRFD